MTFFHTSARRESFLFFSLCLSRSDRFFPRFENSSMEQDSLSMRMILSSCMLIWEGFLTDRSSAWSISMSILANIFGFVFRFSSILNGVTQTCRPFSREMSATLAGLLQEDKTLERLYLKGHFTVLEPENELIDSFELLYTICGSENDQT